MTEVGGLEWLVGRLRSEVFRIQKSSTKVGIRRDKVKMQTKPEADGADSRIVYEVG